MAKDCVLYERKCIECGECLICDLDSNKKCDNCGKCIESESQFRTVKVKEFMENKEQKENINSDKEP